MGEQATTETAPNRRVDAISSAVGFAAELFLTNPDWESDLEEVLARLSAAAGVSRALIVDGDEGSPGRRQADALASGGTRQFLVRDIPESARRLVEADGIQALLFVPVVAGGELWGYIRFDCRDEERVWPDSETRALHSFARTLGAAIERERSDRNRQEAQAKYRALVEHLPAIVYISGLGAEGEWLYVSPQIEAVLGHTPEQWMNHPAPWTTYVHPDDLEDALAAEATSEEDQELKLEYRMYARDGRLLWIRDESRLVRDESGNALFLQGVMFDITKEKEAEQQIAFMAYHDSLTELSNRAMFEQHLNLALARAGRADLAVAVVFMDLDNFKSLNDTRGHAAGDDLLQQIATRLLEAVRETDLVARQGGDEFLVLLADVDVPDDPKGVYRVAGSVADRIHRALEIPFHVGGGEFSTSMSIGVSAYPLDAGDASALMKNADKAMYESKRRGGATTSFARP
jgi:diguanylate cyclase (GGDEF)-like protein/PAS domain S-box-containing protein